MKDGNEKIIVRMAPSPTGNLHIGTARTTLINFLFAKKYMGKFILRIEDTDKERSTVEFEKDILDGLEWLRLGYDDFFRQSERTEIYRSYIHKMLDNGSAFISKEEPKELGQRDEVVRFKNPNKKVVFEDLIRGQVEFDTTELGNFVIARSPEEPLYHLAVVVDDHEMAVTHVIRGEDHVSNTQRQILIQEAIGAVRPIYAHLPLILDSDRKKLSKRKHGEIVWVDHYKQQGYLPEALLNFFALLGWNPGTKQEIFSLETLVEAFDITKVQKSSAIFDQEKLKWINKEHIKLLPEANIKSEIFLAIQASNRFKDRKWDLSNIQFETSWRLFFDRLHTWGDVTEMINSGEFDFIFSIPEYPVEMLLWKNEKSFESVSEHLKKSAKALKSVTDDNWSVEQIKLCLWDYATAVGRGNVLWPLRVALSGMEKSPDPFTISEILGKSETIDRINVAIAKIK